MVDWLYHVLMIAVVVGSLWIFIPQVRAKSSSATPSAPPPPLSRQEQAFLAMLQQIVPHQVIENQNKRFLLYSSTHQLLAIFIYRHEAPSLRDKRQERGIPVFIYKGQFSEEDLRWDIATISHPQPPKPQ